MFPTVRGKESAIGESFSTGRSRNTAIGGSFGPTLFSKNFQSPKGDYSGKSAIGESFSTGRSGNTAIGGSFGRRTLFPKNFQSPKKKKKKSYLHITTVRKLSSRPTFLSHRQDEVRVRPRPGFFFSFFSIVQFLRAKRAPVSPRRSVKISARSVHALWLKVEKTASRHLFLPFFVFLGLFRMRKRLSRHPLAISDREEPRSLRYRPASRLDLSTPKKKSPCPDWP